MRFAIGTRVMVLSCTLLLVALLLIGACGPPPTPPQSDAPDAVLRAFLEAQRQGNAEEAMARWGFGTEAFTAVGDAAAEAALKEDIRHKAAAQQPRLYYLGQTRPSAQRAGRVFVEVWLDRPPQGPPSLYELAQTPAGWKIVAFVPAPEPPLRQP